MESPEIKQDNIENSNQQTIEAVKDVDSPDKIKEELEVISLTENKQEEAIVATTQRVEEIRKELDLPGVVDIPSIEYNKKKIIELRTKKIELENKLSEILKHDVSEKYKDIIDQLKNSKIDWANSEEFKRRLKLKGLDENDVLQVKEWLINNARGTKTIVLPINKYNELKSVISEMTREIVEDAEGFYSPGGREDLPEEGKNAIFMKEKVIPSFADIPEKRFIDEKTLSHELGHATQDGLLEAEQFSNEWNPKFKDNAPDKEYVGQIVETDTRIRSMLNSLSDSLNPEKEVFGKKHLEILREKQKNNLLDKDTKDLLEHYNDIELVKMANRMLAI